ncbi:hypothetical protein GJ744_003880 [Endocarpon pusillum]|uniref:Uncharacterized protein n=1 Tax=Endocarpon pusillum TaxID=364733 RepID=A0A8H7ARM7_9EURO|nr:hypothetical protein GJ744_003880 [Endocarpon pusillum]
MSPFDAASRGQSRSSFSFQNHIFSLRRYALNASLCTLRHVIPNRTKPPGSALPSAPCYCVDVVEKGEQREQGKMGGHDSRHIQNEYWLSTCHAKDASDDLVQVAQAVI